MAFSFSNPYNHPWNQSSAGNQVEYVRYTPQPIQRAESFSQASLTQPVEPQDSLLAHQSHTPVHDNYSP